MERKMNTVKFPRNLTALCLASSLGLSFAASVVSTEVVSAEVVWSEDFNAAELNGKGAVFDTMDMVGVTRWSIDVSSAQLTATSDWFKVTNGVMEARDVDGVVHWLSESIDIQGLSDVQFSVLATEQGSHEASDFWDLAYAVDGGAFISINNWQGNGNASHTLIDDFTSQTITQAITEGSSLQIKVSMQNGASKEYLRLDDIIVSANNGATDPGDGGGGDTITNACFNCPDLTKIAHAADFDDLSYYAEVTTAINTDQNSTMVREKINGAISANHKQLTYAEVWTALTVTDQDPLNSDNVILLYRGISKAKFSNGSGSQSSNQDNWNREHVWAKSHGFSSNSARAYSDIHHLRPTDISVNSSRGNLDFDNSDNALPEAPENRVDGNSFEPRDSVKGDVARMVFYMDIRYAGLDVITPDLQVVDNLTAGGQPQLGKLCTLLSWSENDPVDSFEQNRNDSIYEFQGNRNPFIDHPEWISLIYSQQCSAVDPVDPVDPVEPSPSGDLFFSEYVEGSSFNKAVEIYNPTNSAIDLSTYTFKIYSNGNASPTGTYTLTGEILPNDVVVLGSSQIADSSELKGYVDQFTGAVNFNGDDYIELLNGEIIIDTVGFYAVRQSWGANVTLVRKAQVVSGDDNRSDEFVVADQWESHSRDTFTFLGSHNADAVPTDPVLDPVIGQCGDEADKISAIQGTSFNSPVVDSSKIVEGVVTSTVPSLKGYFVQEESIDSDNNEQSSEAIFVYINNMTNFPVVGNKVRVIGTIKESYGRTQLTATTGFVDCGAGEVIQALALSLPIDNSDNWESYEGMLVSFADELRVTDNYNLARFGQFTLSNGRLIKPTNIYAAGTSAAIALTDKNSRNRIMLDDMNNAQNPDVVPFPAPSLSYQNTLRLGDSVSGIIGILDYSFGQYRVLPTQAPQFNTTNARTAAPQLDGEGRLKIASFNVLNYFNGTGDGQGFPTARGADNFTEFTRQQEKIVAALVAINADVVGLMELENDGFAAASAVADLVNQLNLKMGSDTYAYVSLAQSGIGSDAIAVGLIYKPAAVALVGNAVTTNQAPFDFGNRQPLVQTFKEIATNEDFTVAVNHFKSKGSCGSASGNNQDQNDGQGCWNELRTQAANGLIAWLNTAPTGSDDSDFLIIGDLNSYGKEDPINAITNSGYKNLVAHYLGAGAYSYSFSGEMGYLDHALASDSLSQQVSDTSVWHINADEPRIFDYNTEFKSADQLINYYGDDAYRASDHDPVVILLNLTSSEVLVGDFDEDGDIDINDVRQFSLRLRAGETFDASYDFNGDNVVNSRDVRAMMGQCTRSRCAA
jgi:predicted extracellular nuclease/endonuclease I